MNYMRPTVCSTLVLLLSSLSCRLVAQTEEVATGDPVSAIVSLQLELMPILMNEYLDLFRASALMGVCGNRDPDSVFDKQKEASTQLIFGTARKAVEDNAVLSASSEEMRSAAVLAIGNSIGLALSSFESGYAESLNLFIELDSKAIDSEYMRFLTCQQSDSLAVDLLSEQ